MKVIMIPVTDRPECRVALDQAFRLASDLSANIIGCHLRPHRADEPEPRRSRFRFLLGITHDTPKVPSPRDAELSRQAAHKLFTQRAGDYEFRHLKQPRLGFQRGALWFEMVGALDKLFSIIGPVADMSVVSRPRQTARGRSADFLLAALLHSGRPVLVLPQRPVHSLARRIMIAWNQSADAVRAVSAALPLLIRAETVHICSCGPENRPGPKSVNLAQYLTFWGVKCKRHMSKGHDVPRELEEAYKETESDLIVMGAYSHSRLHELVFGGVTEHMLFRTRKPVLALHS